MSLRELGWDTTTVTGLLMVPGLTLREPNCKQHGLVIEVPRYSTVDGQRKEVGGTLQLRLVELLDRRQGIVGRGTTCWRAESSHPPSASSYVVKYSWPSALRSCEGDHYRVAQQANVIGIAGFVACETFEDVKDGVRRGPMIHQPPAALADRESSGRGNQRQKDQPAFDYDTHMKSHNRMYTRLILRSFGYQLSDPTLTPLQRAQGLLSSFIGHGCLFFHATVLHRDVSAWNTTYTPNPIAIPPCHKDFTQPLPHGSSLNGFIFDLDYAQLFLAGSTPPGPSRAVHQTGTLPFMAIGILRKELHCYRHDIESFFYLLLYCAPHNAHGRRKVLAAFYGGHTTKKRNKNNIIIIDNATRDINGLIGSKFDLVTSTKQFLSFLGLMHVPLCWRVAALKMRDILFRAPGGLYAVGTQPVDEDKLLLADWVGGVGVSARTLIGRTRTNRECFDEVKKVLWELVDGLQREL